jgi:hypothetical protein
LSKQISFRLKVELVEPLKRWLELNNMDQSKLCNLALQKFIASEQGLQKVELELASDEEVFAAASDLMDVRDDALDRLKWGPLTKGKKSYV